MKEIRKTDNYVKLKISFSGFRRQVCVYFTLGFLWDFALTYRKSEVMT